MARRKVDLHCEFLGMGAPDPVTVAFTLSNGQGGELAALELVFELPWRAVRVASGFDTTSLRSFATRLEQLVAGSTQRVELIDFDLGSQIALWADPERPGTIGLSGRFYEGLTDAPDPADGFFGLATAVVLGFQGLALPKASVSALAAEIVAFLEGVGTSPQ